MAAGKIKGITIEIGGDTTKLDKALSDNNKNLSSMGKELKDVNALLKLDPTNIELLSQKQKLLTDSVDETKKKLETLKEASRQAQEQLAEGKISEDVFRELQREVIRTEQSLNNLEAGAEDNAKAIENLGDEEQETAQDTKKMSAEVNDAADNADDAGDKFNALGGVLKSVGALAAGAFAAVGGAAVGATKALADMSVGTAQYADDMLTMSTVTGMSTDALQEYSYAADLIDVSLDTVTATMAKNIKSMDAARDGGKGMVAAYDALGVSVANADGTLRDGGSVYWEAIDALGKMEEGAERDALAMQIFGKSAQDLNPLIATGSEGFSELADEARKMGAVLSSDQLSQAGEFDDAVQRITRGSESAKNALGMVLMPALTELGTDGADLLGQFASDMNSTSDGLDNTEKIENAISKLLEGLNEKIQEVMPLIQGLVQGILSGLINSIISGLPKLLETSSNIILTLINGIITAIPQFSQGAIQIVLALVNGIIAALPNMADAAMQMITAIIDGIGAALPQLIPAAVNAVTTIVQGLVDGLPLLLDSALQLILGLAQGLLDAIPQLVEALPAIIEAVVQFIADAIPQIIDAGIKLLVSLVEALPTIIKAVVEAIPKIITSVIDAVVGSIPQIVEAGIRLFIALIENLPGIIAEIVNAIPKIINSVITAVIGSIPKLINAGIKLFIALVDNLPLIIQTIIEAIPLIIESVITAVTGAVPQLITAGVELFVSLIKNLPAIIIEIVKAVPKIITSLVSGFANSIGEMANVGGNLIKGVWQGISDAGAWLKDKISGFFGGVVDSIKDFFGIASPSKLFAELGGYMAEGLGIGFGAGMEAAAQDMQNAIPTNFDIGFNPNIDTPKGGWKSTNSESSNAKPAGNNGIIINQKFESPKALTPSETARLNRNSAQQLVFALKGV